jgi:flagellar assembly factor FliW
MDTVMHNELEPGEIGTGKLLHLPLGLLGFEHLKQYQLIAEPAETPFCWLQVMGDPSLAFLVVPPFAVLPTYSPDISEEDAAFLGLSKASDALLFNIVTLRPDNKSTVNLKGPVVVNRHTLVAKQVVPTNAAEYPLRHPLPIAG